MYIYTDNFVSSLISVVRMTHDLSTHDIYDLFVVLETCLVHHLLMVLKSDTVTQGFFGAILGRGPRAFQIGKISAVNH